MAKPTLNEGIRDSLIRHQIQTQALVKRQQQKIAQLLAQTEKQVYNTLKIRLKGISLRGADFGPATTARLKLLEKILRDKRIKTFDKVFDVMDKEMQALVRAEAVYTAELIRDETVGAGINVKLNLVLPSVRQLKALVDSKPVMGAQLFQWKERIAEGELRTIMSSVRMGLVQGQTNDAIVKGIADSGGLMRTRSQMDTLVRTAVNFFGSQAREELYSENDDIVSQEMYSATLDDATTVECAALDGELFDVGDGPVPPIHWNCRSIRVPIIDGNIIGTRGQSRATSKDLVDENGDPLTGKARQAKIRELTGYVPADTTYSEFLGRQSKAFQEEVLGVKKAALFRDGGLDLKKFIDTKTFQPKTLQQLYKDNPRAFRAAGIAAP